ncbi:MAG: CoA transferase, partial [Pseudomonadota bacterium]
SLCELMGHPGLVSDPRFADNPSRLANNEALDAIIGAWVEGQDTDAVVDQLEAANIPASKIYTVVDIDTDAQYAARDMLPTSTIRASVPSSNRASCPSSKGSTAHRKFAGPGLRSAPTTTRCSANLLGCRRMRSSL